jgi:molybdopterin synthase catalytic subunit
VPVVYRHDAGITVIFIELKSRPGLASKAQKQFVWNATSRWRAVRTAMALHRSGAVFRHKWEPPQLQP